VRRWGQHLGGFCLALAAIGGAASAQAQTAAAAGGRFDAGLAIRATGSISLSSVDAVERTAGGLTRTVFSSETSIDSSAAAAGWFSVRLTRGIDAEVAVTAGSFGLVTTISHDIEGAPDTAAREDVRQFTFEGGVAVHPPRWTHRQWAPFFDSGVGYVRQLHEGRVLVETGSLLYVGGGTRYMVKSRPGAVNFGLRGDVRATFFKDGVAFDTKYHRVPSLSLSAFVRF
jgi:hypothetical protein